MTSLYGTGTDFIDQAADKIILGPPPSDEEKQAAARFVSRHAVGDADERDLLGMLGLPPVLPAVSEGRAA